MGDDISNGEGVINSSKSLRDVFKKGGNRTLIDKFDSLESISEIKKELILAAMDLLKNIFDSSNDTTKGLDESERVQLQSLNEIISNESLPMEERVEASKEVRKISENNRTIKANHANQTNYLKYIIVVALGGAIGYGTKKLKI